MDYIVHNKEDNYLKLAVNSLNENGFCAIKGFYDGGLLADILRKFKNKFSAKNDIRRSGPYTFNRPDFQRLDLGDYSDSYNRFSRMFTSFVWNKGSDFEDPVRKMIDFRNNLFSLPHKDYIYELNEILYNDLPKICHYPVGGGYMSKHTDHKGFRSAPNVLLSLSKRGVDFEEGGVFYINDKDEFIDIEEQLDIGDLYFHTEETIHGVKTIDPEKEVDLTSLKGRLAINLSLEHLIKE